MRRLTLVTNPDVCNLHCPLCFLNQRGYAFGMGEMPFEVAKAAIEKYAGDAGKLSGKEPCGLREVIPSTMGEPLLYSKFKELLEYCFLRKIPLNLTTNGTFPGMWGTTAGMERLLLACSDIKVSCMGFDSATFTEMMPGISFASWRNHVEKLLDVARRLRGESSEGRKISTVSLQVTLHRGLVASAPEILAWAESVGVSRIKWNLPVFLEEGMHLREKYGIPLSTVRELRTVLKSMRVRSEGSLFFDKISTGMLSEDASGGVSGPCRFFRGEVWVLPDGSEERCPNPERRFGNKSSAAASCTNCALFTL